MKKVGLKESKGSDRIDFFDKKRTIYIDYKPFKYRTKSKLFKILIKNNIISKDKEVSVEDYVYIGSGTKFENYVHIHEGVRIHKNVNLGYCSEIFEGVTIYDNVKIGKNAVICNDSYIAENTKIGKNVRIGNYSYISPDCRIFDNTVIGNYVEIGEGSKLSKNLNITNNAKIKCHVSLNENNINIDGAYKYNSGSYIDERKGTLWIRLGCYTRTLEEWESDFYNNDDEFQIGTERTKLREKTYLMHVKYWKPEFKSFLEKK